MLNEMTFGQRIAAIWQELVEHLTRLSGNDDEDDDE